MAYKLIKRIQAAGLEPDQMLAEALRISASATYSDAHLFTALYRLNSVVARSGRVELPLESPVLHPEWEYLKTERVPLDELNVAYGSAEAVFEQAIRSCEDSKTLGCRHVLEALLDVSSTMAGSVFRKPMTVDMLAFLLSGRSSYASEAGVDEALKSLHDLVVAPNEKCEDFQYALSVDDSGIRFRVLSVLGNFVEETPSGLYVPRVALLPDFKSQFGIFSSDEIDELEELINHPFVKEAELQRFLVEHPHFFRKWDYREVFSQVCLARDWGNLFPDFILTDEATQKAAIVELKLPRAKLVRRQTNRERFAAAISEARAQLIQYRNWFRDPGNRERLKPRVSMEVYEPRLFVIIGRSAEFRNSLDRQQLAADTPDVEIVTYDDLLAYAKQRRVLLDSAYGECYGRAR